MNLFQKHAIITTILLYILVSVIVILIVGNDTGRGANEISVGSYLDEWGCEPGRTC